MKALKAYFEGKNLYVLFLHVAVIALAVEVVVLARQNSELKGGGKEHQEQNSSFTNGDFMALDGLSPIDENNKFDDKLDQVIFTFTTTCPFCKVNFEKWNDLALKQTTNKVAYLGISLDSFDKSLAYIQANKASFPVYYISDLGKFKGRGKLSQVPKTIYRDRSGHIMKIWDGVLYKKEISELENLLSEK